MRYRGKEYTGKGVRVAIIDSGINVDDPRLAGVEIEGWQIHLQATGHAQLSSDIEDQVGHGTDIAVAINRIAPDATLVAVKIMGERLRTSADLMAAGIETSAHHNCRVVNLSLATSKMGKALMLSDCVGNAIDRGSIVLSAAHPRGERAYPADLPDTIGVAAHRDVPLDKFYFFDPKRFSRKDWGVLHNKVLAHGMGLPKEGQEPKFKGPGYATAYMSGYAACLAEALPNATVPELMKRLKRQAITPTPGLGYG